MTDGVQRWAETECPDVSELEELATAEGHSFVTRTRCEWEIGINRFDRSGESFFLAIAEGRIIGICGLNRDPYLDDSSVGRLRHLYVHPSHRRSGVAAALMNECLSSAIGNFERIRLRTSNQAADALYCSLGFTVCNEESATHHWQP